MMIDPVPYDPLAPAPEATTMPLSQLILQDVARGRVRVPRFQRPLRWTARDNVKLIDSLLRGYPIGSLLLWRRPGDADAVPVGSATIPAPAMSDALFVVDGQQRVAAMAGAMLDLPGQDRRFRVYIDVRDHTLVPGTQHRGAVPPHHLALSTLVDTAAYRAWARHSELDDDSLRPLDQLGDRLRNYRMPLYIVDAEAEAEAKLSDIFTRMNATGVRMNADEVFKALNLRGAESSTVDLDALARHPAVQEFGATSRSELLKFVLALSGLDPTRRPESLAESDFAKIAPHHACERALELTLAFLRSDARIPHARLLPYPVVLHILGRYFHLFPQPPTADRVRLAAWLWRGALAGVHQRAEVSRMRDAIRRIEGDPTYSVRQLLHTLPAQLSTEWSLRRFQGRSAASRIELLALLDLDPHQLPAAGPLFHHATGSKPAARVTFDQLLARARIAERILPRSRSSALYNAPHAPAHTSANRILLPESSAHAELRRLHPEQHRDFLTSHLIDPTAHDALRRGDHERFLARRADALRAQVTAFLRRRTGLDTSLMPPLNDYLAAEPA